MSKPQKDTSLNLKTGKRLKEEIERKYGKYSLDDFIRDLDLKGYEISKQTICQTVTGKNTLTHDKATKYAEVLKNIDAAYLLCYQDYRNEEERKVRERAQQINHRIEEYENSIHNIEGYDSALRQKIRDFTSIIRMTGHKIKLSIISVNDLPSDYSQTDFMKAAQLELGSQYIDDYFDDYKLFGVYIDKVTINEVEYSLLNNQFEGIVTTTLNAVTTSAKSLLDLAKAIS